MNSTTSSQPTLVFRLTYPNVLPSDSFHVLHDILIEFLFGVLDCIIHLPSFINSLLKSRHRLEDYRGLFSRQL